jgi:hypothetical protein
MAALDLLVDVQSGEAQGRTKPQYALTVTLVNRSAEALKLYKHALPWEGFHSMLLVAAKTDALGSMLEKTTLIDDPGPETIVLGPGQSLTGTIALKDRFPGLIDALANNDVIVFWSYQCVSIAGLRSERFGGFVLIPTLQAREA